MNKEIQYIISMLRSTYDGEPWYGSSMNTIFSGIEPHMAIQRPGGQHSLLDLLYHIIHWREFTISRLQPESGQTIKYFDENDWVELDHTDLSLWEKGLRELDTTQQRLVALLGEKEDSMLTEQVADRKYDFRFLLHGVVQHDIYHLGQMAYVKKLLD